jgi:hypothetical protein
MSTEFAAPNWTADWLNAWLAAIGATLLVESLSLRWSEGPVPHAVFATTDPVDIPDVIESALPAMEELASLVIAREHPASTEAFPRNVTGAEFRARARLSRRQGDWTLAMTVTDLVEPGDELPHSPFDPPVPRGYTLHERACACRKKVSSPGSVLSSAAGSAKRVAINGLGFDYRRIMPATSLIRTVTVDPVVELLAFVGLMALPARGDGRRPSFRGWTGPATRAGSFTWPVWGKPLDAPGIDAYLDRWWRDSLSGLGFESVPYRAHSDKDPTRGYAARQVMK